MELVVEFKEAKSFETIPRRTQNEICDSDDRSELVSQAPYTCFTVDQVVRFSFFIIKDCLNDE